MGAPLKKEIMILYDINNLKYEVNPKQVIYTKEINKEYTLYKFVDGTSVELKRIKAEYAEKVIPITKFEDIKY